LLPIALLLLVVIAGALILLHAEATVSTSLHEEAGLVPPRHDVKPLVDAAKALVSGQGSYPYYGDSIPLGYAPPYVPLMVPLALLPRGLAYALSVLLCTAFTLVTLAAWARRDGELPGWFWAVVLSVPVFALVRIDQLMTAIGFAALSGAIFVQRRDRWWLSGALVALGLIRTANALPVMAMLVVGGWGRWNRLAQLAGGLLVVLVPLGAIATIWDAHWLQHYGHNLQVLPIVGPMKLIREQYGLTGTLLLQLGGCAAAAAIVLPSRGKPLELDRASLGLALSLVVSVVATFYPAIFVMPGLVRVAQRRGMSGVAWMAAFLPWLAILALAGPLFGPHPLGTLNLLTVLDLVLLGGCYPLFRTGLSPPRAVG
jgi:hypothetical protein